MINQPGMKPVTPEHLAFTPLVWQEEVKDLQKRGFTVSKHEHSERMSIVNENVKIAICNSHAGNLLLMMDKPVRVSRVIKKDGLSIGEYYQAIVEAVESLLEIAGDPHAVMLAGLFVDARDMLNVKVISRDFLLDNEDMILILQQLPGVGSGEGTA